MLDNLNKVLSQSPGVKTFLAIGGAIAALFICLLCLLWVPVFFGGAITAEPVGTATFELPTSMNSLTVPAVPTNTPSQTNAISTLPAGTQSPPTSATPCPVSISGTVYNDLNANRSRDANEPGIPGIGVNLQNASGATMTVGITDGAGAYSFTNLPLGSYRLQVLVPPGWNPTTPSTISVSISACSAISNLDFGLSQSVLQPPQTTPAPIIITATPQPPPPTTPAPIIITATPQPTNTLTPPPTATSTFTPTPSPTIGFMVTGVTASVDYTPKTRCPGSFEFRAYITVNQAGTVTYRWERSDGSTTANQTITFLSGGTQAVNDYWRIPGAPGFIYNGWEQVEILAPNSKLSNQASFTLICPQPAPANVNFATSGLPSGVQIKVNYSGTDNGGQPVSGSVQFTSPGPSPSVSTKPGTSFLYSGFPISVTVGYDTYYLGASLPASRFTTGASGSTTTVTASYSSYYRPQIPRTNPLSDTTVSLSTTSGRGTFYSDSTCRKSITLALVAGSGVSVSGLCRDAPIGLSESLPASFGGRAPFVDARGSLRCIRFWPKGISRSVYQSTPWPWD